MEGKGRFLARANIQHQVNLGPIIRGLEEEEIPSEFVSKGPEVKPGGGSRLL